MITIGMLTFLTYKTTLGVFLIASFDLPWFCCMDIPKVHSRSQKYFFWTPFNVINRYNLFKFYTFTFVYSNTFCSRIGCKLNDSFKCNSSSGWGNPVIVIIGSVSLDYLINPILIGSIIILIFGIILNRLILKKEISFINGHKV